MTDVFPSALCYSKHLQYPGQPIPHRARMSATECFGFHWPFILLSPFERRKDNYPKFNGKTSSAGAAGTGSSNPPYFGNKCQLRKKWKGGLTSWFWFNRNQWITLQIQATTTTVRHNVCIPIQLSAWQSCVNVLPRSSVDGGWRRTALPAHVSTDFKKKGRKKTPRSFTRGNQVISWFSSFNPRSLCSLANWIFFILD